jgi:Tol biopolymer transport system component
MNASPLLRPLIVALSLSLAACGGGGGGGGGGPGGGRFPLSAPGDLVALTADVFESGTEHLVVADVQGRGSAVLTESVLGPGAQCEKPIWSSDHRLIALPAAVTGSSGTELFVVDPQRGDPVLVSGSLAAGEEVTEVQWQPGGARLAFRTSGPVGRAFLVRPDGSGRLDVTGALPAGAEGVLDIAWAPDGSRLALKVDNEGAGNTDVVTLLPDGSGRVKVSGAHAVATGRIAELLWAPDGSRIAFTGDMLLEDVDELFTVAATGVGGRVKLNGPLPPGAGINLVAWAPDASRVAFLAAETSPLELGLFTCLPNGTGRVAVSAPAASGGGVSTFVWSPDSARLAYDGRINASDVPEVFTVGPDGSAHAAAGPAPVAGGGAGGNSGAKLAWAPNAARLAFTGDFIVDGQTEVFTCAAAGGGRLKHTDSLQAACEVSSDLLWNPASSRLAYRANHITPDPEPFVVAVPGISPVALADVLADGAFLFVEDWSLDGSRLLVSASPGGGSSGNEMRGYAPDGLTVVLVAGPFVGRVDEVAVR